MLITPRCARIAAAGAVGAGALTSALLFGATPTAQAAPPATITTVAQAPQLGPHAIPVRGGNGWGGHGHGGWGHGGGWGRGGGWGHGWGHGGWGRPWWNWWW